MYLIPFAAVALASCSNESIDSQEKRVALNEGTALNIAPAVQGTTRGTITTDANFTQFRVKASGSDNFYTTSTAEAPSQDAITNGTGSIGTSFQETVNLNTSTGKWYIGDTEGTYYWWKSKSMTGSFEAWAPYSTATGAFAPGSEYQVKSDLDQQEDIIVAYNTGAGSDFTSGVPLNFQHAMSQVIIKALNKDASSTKIEVAGIRLNNLKNTGKLASVTTPTTSGTFAWPDGAWNLGSPTAIYNVGSTDAAEPASGITVLTTAATQLTSTPFLLMPQTTAKADLTAAAVSGAYFSVLIRVTDIADNKVTYPTWLTSADGVSNVPDAGTLFAYVAVPVDIDWKPGYKYTYTLNFSSTGIGKVDPSQPTDKPDDALKYPTGKDTPAGTDIVDGPVQLYFTTTVEEWTDGGNNPIDM